MDSEPVLMNFCCAGRECDRRSGSWDVEPDDSCRTHDLHVEIVASKHEIEELRAENERLRAALKPFANYADAHRVVPSYFVITQGWIIAKRPLMMGDCYEACRVLGGV